MNRSILIVMCDFLVSAMLSMLIGMSPHGQSGHMGKGALLDRGFDLVTGGTDNHLMLADLRKKNITGKDLQIKLDEVHITVNKNAIPNDPEKPFVTSKTSSSSIPRTRAH